MANMSYCRFENTANDLQDCIYAIQDNEINQLSSYEIRGAKDLLELAKDLINNYEDNLLEGIRQSEIYNNKNLLIFENNLSFEITDFQSNKFKKIYLISNKNENRSIKLSEKVIKFKSLLIEDQEQILKAKSIDCEVIDISEIKKIENFYGLYPTVGENLDYLNSNNLKIDYLYRKLDQYSWQYCNKGFFNFKNYIPKIISTFN